jgi:hypothetical protein
MYATWLEYKDPNSAIINFKFSPVYHIFRSYALTAHLMKVYSTIVTLTVSGGLVVNCK